MEKLNKNIIHIASDECSRNYQWEKNYNKLDPNLQIVSIDELRNSPESSRLILKSGNSIKEGMVFLKDPFSSNYINILDAEEYLFKSKMSCLSHIASLLGAKKVEGKAIYVEESNRELDVNGNVKCHYVKADASYKETQKERYASKYHVCDNFEGDCITSQTYEQARQIVSTYNLDRDIDIRTLLDNRNPSHQNKITRREVNIELSRDIEEATSAAFSLNVLNGVFSLSTGVNEIISKSKKINYQMIIEF